MSIREKKVLKSIILSFQLNIVEKEQQIKFKTAKGKNNMSQNRSQ